MRLSSPVTAILSVILGLGLFACFDTTGLEPLGTDGGNPGTGAQVTSLELNVLSARMYAGNAFTPSANGSDDQGNNLTGLPVTWLVSDSTVATIGGNGTIVARRAGHVQITATLLGVQAAMGLDVAAPTGSTIMLAPAQLSTVPGTQVQLQLNDSHGATVPTGTVIWMTSNPKAADIDYNGMLTAHALGGTVVTATTSDGRSTTSTVTVTPAGMLSLLLSPGSLSLRTGAVAPLSAVVSDSEGDTLSGVTVTWSTSAPAVATVSGDGHVTAIGAGSAVITASATPPGGGTPLTATVSVTVASERVPVASVAVTPPSATVRVGQVVHLTATAYDAGANPLSGRTASWVTADATVATVATDGSVTGVAVGSTSVTVTVEGQSATVPITVSTVPVASVTVGGGTLSAPVGTILQLTATAKDASGNVLPGRGFTWSTANSGVASVSPSGVVTGVSAGSASISATSEGVRGSVTVTVTPPPVASVVVTPGSVTLPLNATAQLTATPYDATGHALTGRTVTWTSSADALARISATGLVTAVATGGAKITATIEGQSGQASVTVAPASVGSVTINPTTASVQQGKTQQLTATVLDSRGQVLTGRSITWLTSNPNMATVSSSGMVSGVAPGTVNVSATSGGVSGSASITVTPQSGGTVLAPGDNIQAAVDKYPAGTAFTLLPGVFRMQTVTPKNGDTFTGQAGTIMSGARVLTNFTRSGSLWVTRSQDKHGDAEGQCLPAYPACQFPEDLFINNQMLLRVASLGEVAHGTWYYDYTANNIYLADDPTSVTVEMGVVQAAFKGLASRVTIRNIVVEKYDTPAQLGAISADNTNGWTVDNVEVRFVHGAGIHLGNSMTLINSSFHHNGQYGVGATNTHDAVVQYNEIAYNSTVGYDPSWGAGATKFAMTTNLVVRGNNVHHNKGKGLWTDIDNRYTLYEGNTVTDNDGQGIFHEISYDAIIRNNDCERNGFGGANDALSGAGILVAASPNVEIYANRVVGNANGIGARQENRGSGAYGPYNVQNLAVHDNTVTMDRGYSGLVSMSGDQSFFTSRNNRFYHDTYHYGSSSRRFAWLGQTITDVQWRQAGQETDGTFAP
jgi:parallel beta-helix repeat protein